MLEKRIIDLIDFKAADLNGKGDIATDVSKIINKLNSYINQEFSLTENEVDKYLINLGGYFSTSMYIPIAPETKFLRARTFDNQHLETKVSELSYISKDKRNFSNMGRLNPKGVPIYYGCIYFNDIGGINVGFAEINAEANKTVNILRSVNTHYLNLYYVGIYDLVHRNCKPQFMSDEMFEKYNEVYEYQEQVFSQSAFLAHQLCDAFFSEILRSKEYGDLYKVTSRLPTLYLEEDTIDGIIYTSVKAEGSPVVVIKTESIDSKFSHRGSDSFDILYDYGYAKYQANHTHTGTINNNKISWISKT